jgi:hypothetical protein
VCAGRRILFGGVSYTADPNTVSTAENPYLDIDPSGLNPLYAGGSGENQTHHYSALLLVGYFRGWFYGIAGNFVRETEQALVRIRGGDPLLSVHLDPGDVPLGTAAAVAGSLLSESGYVPGLQDSSWFWSVGE